MDHSCLASIFHRPNRPSTSENRKRTKNSSDTGSHELFFEYGGFLLDPAPRIPSTSQSQLTALPAFGLRHYSRVALSEATAKAPKSSHARGHRSFSSFTGAIADFRPFGKKVVPRQRKSTVSGNGFAEKEDTCSDLRSNSDYVDRGESPAHRDGWLRKCLSSTFRSGRPSTLLPAYRESPFEDDCASSRTQDAGFQRPRILSDFSSGAAARAAAAAQNEILESMRNMRLAEAELTRDSESGVGIEVRDNGEVTMDFSITVVRQDPVLLLPPEIMGHVLTYLDSNSLMNAELVSYGWHQLAISNHIWKQVFRAEFLEASQSGRARGQKSAGRNRSTSRLDWKNMWRARKALQQRWIDGRAAAIYLEGHTDSVYCVQFDENKIITGSRDRTVRIWDAHTYECIKILGVPSRDPGTGIPPLPKDVTDRGQRPFAKVVSPTPTKQLSPTILPVYHSGSVLCLQYDDEIMVTGSSDCTLIVWDLNADYSPFRRLRHHTAGVLDVCFDEKYIVSCSKDTTICLWNRHTCDFIRSLGGHRGPVNAVQLRGDLAVSASGDCLAKLWNLTSGLCIKEFPSKDRGMACVEFSPDSRTILAGGNDQVIYQFDTSSGELVRELKGHEGLVRSLHLESSSDRVVSGSYDTSVKAFDLRTGDMIVNFTKWTSSWILSAKADYRRIIATSQDSRAVIMDFGYQLPGIEALEV